MNLASVFFEAKLHVSISGKDVNACIARGIKGRRRGDKPVRLADDSNTNLIAIIILSRNGSGRGCDIWATIITDRKVGVDRPEYGVYSVSQSLDAFVETGMRAIGTTEARNAVCKTRCVNGVFERKCRKQVPALTARDKCSEALKNGIVGGEGSTERRSRVDERLRKILRSRSVKNLGAKAQDTVACTVSVSAMRTVDDAFLVGDGDGRDRVDV
jgi:hypothetical protein